MIIGISNPTIKTILFTDEVDAHVQPAPNVREFSLQEFLKLKIELIKSGWEIVEV